MPSEFRLPALGADMESGAIVQWNVAPGSPVRRGDVVAVVDTDKGAIDVEIFENGVVREILVQPGPRVPVGTVLALLDVEGEARAEPSATAQPLVTSAAAPQPATLPTATATATAAAAPLVPPPTGSDHPAGAPGAAGAGEGMREAIAAAMSRSKREIPHYYLATTADLTATVEWLAARNASVPVAERLLFAALLVKAIALSCGELPGFSGCYVDGRYAQAPIAHVGVAVALRGGGLVAPAILNAADKSLPELMTDFRGLVTRARAGRLRASELSAPTIILTSLGDAGVDAVFPIIQPPQVAIVGAGALVQRPGLVDGRIESRQFLTLSLGADHRVSDGRLGARFLSRIVARLADPHTL
jgi:pyruvate dehydrogenase E2 component (dihydrolipoamide acetyltransferase)